MSTVFLRSGSVFRPASEADLDMHQQLPAACYIIVKHPMTGALMFQTTDSFGLPPKLYGNIEARADRIINTYRDRPNSTGVLLSGEKGSGKTQLARLVAVKAAEQAGIPCIIINQAWVGDEFFALIQSVHQECIIFFDEFEKVYDSNEQKQVLTLLDGVFPSKKLFLLTCNDKWLINDHMRNRPGRIYYLLDFRGLDDQFILEYCEDALEAKQHIPSIRKVAKMFSEFNFDMLKAMVEEMNRYGETPEQVLEMLNARPTTDTEGTYKITLVVDGAEATRDSFYPTEWEGSPMHESEITVSWEPPADPEDDDSGAPAPTDTRPILRSARQKAAARRGRQVFTLRQNHLSKFNGDKGEFEYVLDDVVVRFTRIKRFDAQYLSLLA